MPVLKTMQLGQLNPIDFTQASTSSLSNYYLEHLHLLASSPVITTDFSAQASEMSDTSNSDPASALPADAFEVWESKAYSKHYDPCQEAANRSIKCLHRNPGDKSLCSDYFQYDNTFRLSMQ